MDNVQDTLKKELEKILEAMFEKHRQLRESSGVLARCILISEITELRDQYNIVASNILIHE